MSWFSKFLCKVFHIGCPTPPSPTPQPGPSRPGLLFGYFGMQPGDAAQIADHVNYVHVGSWGDWETPAGRAYLMQTIIDYGHESVAAGIHRLIFTTDFCTLTPTNPRQLLPTSTASAYLTEFKNRLETEGLMQYVIGWYPMDEPNIPEVNLSAQQVEDNNSLLRYIMQDGKPLYCIYGYTSGTYPALGSFNVAGFDNYGAPIFSNGMYDNLVNQMGALQKTMIVPGGGNPWRENPWSFYNKAQSDSKVEMIMAFKWFDPDGIKSNGMAAEYRAVGQLIKAANP